MSRSNPECTGSRRMSYLLRHDPEELDMDNQGWVLVDQLLKKLGISMEKLEYIVTDNDKKRFGFNENKTKIRAHQGHSSKLGLSIKFKEVQFPQTYYHGTDFLNQNSILKHGIRPGNRAYVHLSKDVKTAINVGRRHGDTVLVLEIDANQMKRDGLKIMESENGVILVTEVPPKYIKIKQ
jgi:putative RNA 2'-phosphotransferase